MNSTDWRSHFPYLAQSNAPIYLDNAATTQKPQRVIDALTRFYTMHTAPIARSIYDHAEYTTELYENARATVAYWVGADPDEIIFTSGATAGINTIALTWGVDAVSSGDHIVVSQLEHHSNLIPWMLLAKKKGAHLTYIPTRADGTLVLESLEKIISTKTKLIAITHTSNVTGATTDLELIVARARNVGAKVLVDAAQSAPHQLIDVHRLGIDFLVFSGHKMLGPTGIGVLYVKKELQDMLSPYQFGGGMITGIQHDSYSLRHIPHRFEPGTPPIAQAIGLAAAIEYLQETVDFETLKRHEAQLCKTLLNGLSEIDGITSIGPYNDLVQCGHIVSFVVDGMHPHDVAAYLNYYGICVRAGQLCAAPALSALGHNAVVRASFYLYNTQEEVNYLVDVLKSLPTT